MVFAAFVHLLYLRYVQCIRDLLLTRVAKRTRVNLSPIWLVLQACIALHICYSQYLDQQLRCISAVSWVTALYIGISGIYILFVDSHPPEWQFTGYRLESLIGRSHFDSGSEAVRLPRIVIFKTHWEAEVLLLSSFSTRSLSIIYTTATMSPFDIILLPFLMMFMRCSFCVVDRADRVQAAMENLLRQPFIPISDRSTKGQRRSITRCVDFILGRMQLATDAGIIIPALKQLCQQLEQTATNQNAEESVSVFMLHQNQAPGFRDGAANSRIPPGWSIENEKRYPLRYYRRDLEVWTHSTDVTEARQGPAALQQVVGAAAIILREMPIGILVNGDDVDDGNGQMAWA